MYILETRQLTKIYNKKNAYTKALDNYCMKVTSGEFLGIMGPSGSGKSTLLNILGTLDTPTEGHVIINGKDIVNYKNNEVAQFRKKSLGFIFQDFNLMNNLTIKENIILPLTITGEPVFVIEEKLKDISQILNIQNILNKYPYEVSGGQQQRAGAARAIIKNPLLILADEPTGNLDSKSAKDLMQCLVKLNKQYKTTIVMVTHDPLTASYCSSVVFIKDGKCFNQFKNNGDNQAFYNEILEALKALEVCQQ